MSTLQFLLLEDKTLDAEAIQAVLSDGSIDYKLLQVDTRVDFVTALETHELDLILAAYAMPGLDGMAALEIARTLRPETPFIFVSASLGEEVAIETLKQGATDYVLKQRLERLVPAVNRALRESQERRNFKKAQQDRERFLAVSSDLQMIIGFDHLIQWVSPSFERLLGWSASEIIGQPWFHFAYSDDIDGFQQASNAGTGISHDELLTFENRYRHKDGSYRWFTWSIQQYLAEQVIYAVAVDITERKQTEATLRQRETELRVVTNAVPALISFVDADQRYRFNNQSYEDWFGHPATEIYGKRLQEVLGEAAYQSIRPYVEQVLTGQQVTFESQVPYRDGGIRYVSATYVPQFDAEGSVAGFAALVNDITDRKQAEAALQTSEQRYRLLAEAIPQFVWIADAEGQNEYVNQRFCDYTGLPAEQMQGLNWLAIVHPDDLESTRDRWLTAVNRSQFYETEYRFRHFDGNYRWFLGQGIPLRDEQGQIRQWVGTCTDIEPQKQIEQARLRLLEQERIAREQAENANRLKDEFLAVLSHELRSPLNPILGWTRLLQNGKLDEARRTEALKTIERNAKLQSQLIEDLLDISRIMQGKLSLTVTPVSLEFVITAAIETVRLAAEAKNIKIMLDLDPAIAPISGDAARLQQVVWNLLTNAVKFMPSGGQVQVKLEAVGNRKVDEDKTTSTPSPPYSYAQITITDTGKGIDPEFLPHVFEYFQQEDGSTTRKFGGLGLGLAIVRQIVEMHGGIVKAESQGEDQGATFIVQLPTMPKTTAIASQPTPTPTNAEAPLTHIQILLVDDEIDTREFQAFLLEQNGAKVTAVASGLEALQAIDQFIPDIIISDVGMAEMDGYMLIQQIRSRPVEQGGMIPAIALTAYAAEIDREKALQAGFQAHITKPVDSEGLIGAIASLYRASK